MDEEKEADNVEIWATIFLILKIRSNEIKNKVQEIAIVLNGKRPWNFFLFILFVVCIYYTR